MQSDIPNWVVEFIRLEPQIIAALEYSQGTHNVDDVLQQIATGELQLWPGKDSVLITQIITYPRKRALHIFLAGGNQRELKEMNDPVVQWAKAQGCTTITLTGRLGWSRSEIREIGFETTHVMMSKEI